MSVKKHSREVKHQQFNLGTVQIGAPISEIVQNWTAGKDSHALLAHMDFAS